MNTAEMAKGQYVGAKTAVWWDIENCQVPKGFDANMIAQNISSALMKMNYCGPVSISAYGDTSGITPAIQHALNSWSNGVPNAAKPAASNMRPRCSNAARSVASDVRQFCSNAARSIDSDERPFCPNAIRRQEKLAQALLLLLFLFVSLFLVKEF